MRLLLDILGGCATSVCIDLGTPAPSVDDEWEERVQRALAYHRERYARADGHLLLPDIEERIAVRFDGASEHYRVWTDGKVVRVFRVVDEERGLFVSRYVWSWRETDAVIDYLEARAAEVAAANPDPFEREPAAPAPSVTPKRDAMSEAMAALDAALGLG